MKLFTFCALLMLYSTVTFSQQIKGRIIDTKSGEPVAFATIQYNEDKGVISNMEGYFAVASEDLKSESVLTFSFMGYQTQELTVNKLQEQNNIVRLVEAVNQLSTVYVTNRLPNVDSILARVNRNLSKNYRMTNAQHTLFSRETSYFKATNLEVDVEKSSGFNKKQLAASNSQFKDLTNYIVNNPPTQTFTDILIDLYLKPDYNAKMNVRQATKLKDQKNSLSMEFIQEKVTDIVLQHLDTSKTYKLKTGWFKIQDSMSLKKNKKIKKDTLDPKFLELKNSAINRHKDYLFQNEDLMDFVKDTNGYTYELENISTIDDQLVYIVKFEPNKSRAKFTGRLYIADTDYAILKMDYSFAEGKLGQKLNLKLLLGVKYAENINKGTVIYKKNFDTDSYYPYYINHESGQYVYAHRPFKFTENSDNTKNKVSFDLKIEGTEIEKFEWMSLQFKSSDEATYNNIAETNKFNYIILKQYDPSLWKDYTIMEPLDELKKFKVED